MNEERMSIATFAGGCFWCIEAVFQQLKGVEKVESGYIGGDTENPTYREVCSGTTGHAEACNVYYDADLITYEELLTAFWTAHDPTTLNRQGNDVGTQYRSAIFYHNEEQKDQAEASIRKLEEEKIFDAPIVTELAPYTTFYKAEVDHQNYYNDHPMQGYCTFIIRPKVEKIRAVFSGRLNN